ncbi:MAG: hypothetical protein GXP62_07680 [Oligoflexia bacterium]|nr:hypothetical protein [Oligoflexia bacterium]
MPILNSRPIIPRTWHGGRNHGGIVLPPGGLTMLEVKDGNDNIFNPQVQLGVIHCFPPNSQFNQTSNYVEYWVLFDYPAFDAGIHNNKLTISYSGTGGESWANLLAQYQQNEGSADWKWYSVTYTYQAVTAFSGGTNSAQSVVLNYGTTEVGRMGHVHAGQNIVEHWVLYPTFTTPSSGNPFDMVSVVPDRNLNWVKAAAPLGSQYVLANVSPIHNV